MNTKISSRSLLVLVVVATLALTQLVVGAGDIDLLLKFARDALTSAGDVAAANRGLVGEATARDLVGLSQWEQLVAKLEAIKSGRLPMSALNKQELETMKNLLKSDMGSARKLQGLRGSFRGYIIKKLAWYDQVEVVLNNLEASQTEKAASAAARAKWFSRLGTGFRAIVEPLGAATITYEIGCSFVRLNFARAYLDEKVASTELRRCMKEKRDCAAEVEKHSDLKAKLEQLKAAYPRCLKKV